MKTQLAAKESGRWRVMVDASWAIFRYRTDDPPMPGDFVVARSGAEFRVIEVAVDERRDHVMARAVSTGRRL